MHALTIQPKYIFGDRVRFDSPTQGKSGTGKIVAITIYAEGPLDYMIDQGEENNVLQPGILEHEITLLGENW